MTRWQKRTLSATEKRARAREKALADCQRGEHRTTPTLRPGEKVCLSCGVVFYCPDCLQESHLEPLHRDRVYPLVCAAHRETEVRSQ